MFCPECGKESPDGSRFCQGCGTPLTAVLQTSEIQPVNQQPEYEITAPQYFPEPKKRIDRSNLKFNIGSVFAVLSALLFGMYVIPQISHLINIIKGGLPFLNYITSYLSYITGVIVFTISSICFGILAVLGFSKSRSRLTGFIFIVSGAVTLINSLIWMIFHIYCRLAIDEVFNPGSIITLFEDITVITEGIIILIQLSESKSKKFGIAAAFIPGAAYAVLNVISNIIYYFIYYPRYWEKNYSSYDYMLTAGDGVKYVIRDLIVYLPIILTMIFFLYWILKPYKKNKSEDLSGAVQAEPFSYEQLAGAGSQYAPAYETQFEPEKTFTDITDN